MKKKYIIMLVVLVLAVALVLTLVACGSKKDKEDTAKEEVTIQDDETALSSGAGTTNGTGTSGKTYSSGTKVNNPNNYVSSGTTTRARNVPEALSGPPTSSSAR